MRDRQAPGGGDRGDLVELELARYFVNDRRFDGALTGLGGCPFAGDELVGNIATETILAALGSRGADAEIRPEALGQVIAMTEEIRAKYSHAAIA